MCWIHLHKIIDPNRRPQCRESKHRVDCHLKRKEIESLRQSRCWNMFEECHMFRLPREYWFVYHFVSQSEGYSILVCGIDTQSIPTNCNRHRRYEYTSIHHPKGWRYIALRCSEMLSECKWNEVSVQMYLVVRLMISLNRWQQIVCRWSTSMQSDISPQRPMSLVHLLHLHVHTDDICHLQLQKWFRCHQKTNCSI